MAETGRTHDMLVIGAGPIGIACGVEAVRRGLDCVLLDKGAMTDALCRYPSSLIWFSTPELLEIGGVP